jgi:hypothetical protein
MINIWTEESAHNFFSNDHLGRHGEGVSDYLVIQNRSDLTAKKQFLNSSLWLINHTTFGNKKPRSISVLIPVMFIVYVYLGAVKL